jgi:hypothetical protein
MALSNADKEWIRREIREAIHGVGWRKLGILIRTWSLPGVAGAFLLFLWLQWGVYVEFRTHTSDRLDVIEKNLTQLELQDHASLPQSLFEMTLPDLRTIVSAARKENVKASPKVIEDLQSKLLGTSPGVPDFWPTVSEFITYRSTIASTSPEQTRKLLTEALPNCTDSLPKSMKIKQVLDPNNAVLDRGVYEHCRVTLDSAHDNEIINTILNSRTPLITFRDCLIVYRGGQIKLILAWDKMPVSLHIGHPGDNDKRIFHVTLSTSAITFENCLFDFSVQTLPPSEGQKVSVFLLAQNSATVNLPSAK